MAAWQGGWDDVFGVTHSLQVDKDPARYHLARRMKSRGGLVIAEKLKTLLDDATPASTASVTSSRVEASQQLNDIGQGGQVTIETETLISAAVTAADVTDLQKILYGGSEQEHQPPTYPTDAAGNGGGGKGATESE